jgi:cytochrome c553
MPLAEHFRDLNPKPFGKAPKGLVATGKQIYEVGVPEANLVACAACHGPEAKGEGPNPRLAGQLYPYTLKVLRNWSRERGQNRSAQDLSSVMTPIVQNMTKSQMSAVAAYLSHLK